MRIGLRRHDQAGYFGVLTREGTQAAEIGSRDALCRRDLDCGQESVALLDQEVDLPGAGGSRNQAWASTIWPGVNGTPSALGCVAMYWFQSIENEPSHAPLVAFEFGLGVRFTGAVITGARHDGGREFERQHLHVLGGRRLGADVGQALVTAGLPLRKRSLARG